MKILYLADSSSWHNAKWTEYFSEKHEVHLLSDFKKDYPKVNFSQNVTLHEYPPIISSHNRHLNKLVSVFDLIYKARRLCEREQFDIIHSVALYYAFIATFLNYNAPKIYTQQGSELLVRADKKPVYRYMARRVFQHVTCVTGDSKVIQKKGIELGAPIENNFIIQNGVDLRTFYRVPKIRKSNAPIRIFSPRAFDDLYNIDIIIECLSLLKFKYDLDFVCEFAFGFGNQNVEKMTSLASELGVSQNIRLLGFLDHKEMISHYQNSDICLSIPSSDSSPKSVYEGMACGTATIISKLPWLEENIVDGRHAVVVDVRNAVQTAEAVVKLVNNPKIKLDIEDSAIKLVKEKFSFLAEMSKMENVMEQLIDKHQKAKK